MISWGLVNARRFRCLQRCPQQPDMRSLTNTDRKCFPGRSNFIALIYSLRPLQPLKCIQSFLGQAMNCAGSHMASASFSNSAGLLWAAVKHKEGFRDWCRSFTSSQWAQAMTYGAICIAFGMDWRKGALTFRDAFPAMSSPGFFLFCFLRHSTCSLTHSLTHPQRDAQ